MHTNQRALLVRLVLVLMFPLIFSGCISSSDHGSRGVRLSEAMNASANDDHRDLGGRGSHDDYSDDDTSTTTGVLGGLPLNGVSYDDVEYHWQIPIDVNYAMPFNGEIQGITHFTISPICFEDEQNFLGLYLGGAIVDIKRGSLPYRAVDNTWMLETGLTYRRYLNSVKTAFSPYIAASAGFVMFNWDYRNAIYAGGDTIQSDALLGGQGTISFGISTRRQSWVCAFGEVGLGGTFFSGATTQGFDNDVFHNFGFVSFKAGVSFKF